MLEEILAALGLPPDAAVEPAFGGASGAAWQVRTRTDRFVLRRSSSELVEGRLAAMAAARDAGLPAPTLHRRASLGGEEAVLLEWLPGTRLLDVVARSPADAAHWGTRMGQLQRRLHEVAGPPEAIAVAEDPHRPFSAGRDTRGIPAGDRLLHLDWHPLNLLADETSGELCGIVDWDNARSGDPLLDLARTHSILTLEPSLAQLPTGARAALAPLLEGWTDGYGPEARSIPVACQTWAARVMLADLERRYADRPGDLDPVRRAIQG